MGLPYRSGSRRKLPVWQTFDLQDPSFEPTIEPFEEDGVPKTREVPGSVKIALRPLLDTEIDLADEASAKFVAKHLTGGWIDDMGQFQKEPQPIFIDGLHVPLAEGTVNLMHRYEAMQEPLAGMPPRPDGVRVVDVAEMVEAASGLAEEFWKGLQAKGAKVWREGVSGKAWAGGSATPPTP